MKTFKWEAWSRAEVLSYFSEHCQLSSRQCITVSLTSTMRLCFPGVGADLGSEGLRNCIQLRNIGKSGPKGKFKIKKDKAGQMGKYKRENSESWLVLRKVLQQCTLKNHFKREREKEMLLINSLLVKKDRNKKTYQEMQCSVYRRMVWNIL